MFAQTRCTSPKCYPVPRWVLGGGNYLIHHPFNFVEGHGVIATIIKAGGPSGLVAGHLLRHFQLAAVLQICRDAGGAEAVATDFRFDAGGDSAALNHHVDVGLG
jgi:hypothetical protein